MSNIALDFDETFTADPVLWMKFIDIARDMGHRVYIVTIRDEHRDGINWSVFGLKEPPVPVVWCDGVPKRRVVEKANVKIDIWIDDNPYGILHGTSLKDKAALQGWRKTDRYRNSQHDPDGESRGWEHKEKSQ